MWPLEAAANGDAPPLPTLCWQPSAQQAETMAAKVWRWGGAATARTAAAWDQHAGETLEVASVANSLLKVGFR